MHYDWLIIGSGFGGSVSALRLSEKGYRVGVLEKGRRWAASDFPKTNWNLKRWMWMPAVGWRGIFKMTFFRHVTILSGVGVGGGSLVYANTLPIPKAPFFRSGSWAGLADWQSELAPWYRLARGMLGAAPNPKVTTGDEVLRSIAQDIGREDGFEPTHVAVYFGQPGRTAPDPYFGGEGPERVGCNFCGGCMTGCRHGSKNTLDRNYLYLAEKLGAEVHPDTEVVAVRPRAEGGYEVEAKLSLGWLRTRTIRYTADNVVFSGGVLGTVPLLLRLRERADCLPKLSRRVGEFIRTNSEALIGVVSKDPTKDFSTGVAITSILHTDEHSHIEPVRYAKGSGFFRIMALPHANSESFFKRLAIVAGSFLRRPLKWARVLTMPDFARSSQTLLYMRSLEGTMRFRLGRSGYTGFLRKPVSEVNAGEPAPTAFIPEATELAERFAEKVDGVTMTLAMETVLGTPSTAHILGGACMGATAEDGVIDGHHRVHNYPGLYVVDGAAVSANPGVNPSLTITALAERAMSLIPPKAGADAPVRHIRPVSSPDAGAA